MTKAEAGQRGGLATLKRHGNNHMRALARKGAEAMHRKYRLSPLGNNDFAIVNRETGIPTGKTIRGLELWTMS